LKDARRGDVLLVESIDRLSRMDDQAWRSLKTAIDNRGIRIVSVDLPTSHTQSGDEFTDRMLAAINYMMIDMMAAIARKDYQQRRLRQAQGIEKAKASGVYKGRPVDAELRNRVRELLAAGLGIRAVRFRTRLSSGSYGRLSQSWLEIFTLLAFVISVPVCPPREINWTESSDCRSNSIRTRMG
ncbi:putative resolvase, partial [Pseudomonas syringae pv. actinidiae ICMP 19068]